MTQRVGRQIGTSLSYVLMSSAEPEFTPLHFPHQARHHRSYPIFALSFRYECIFEIIWTSFAPIASTAACCFGSLSDPSGLKASPAFGTAT